MSVLTLENVSFSYDQTPILKNISFTFEPGQIYAITGRSGTGKTTLLSLLAGLTVPTSGSIYYHDKNLASMNTYDFRRQQVGVIFQGFNLLTKLTAFENVLLSLELSNVSVSDKKEHVYDLLARVGIDHEQADRRVLQLSGGQQQRVAIARALASQPDVILADEPTGNLDAETEASIIQIFKDLADQGKCVILVTHTPAVAQAADQILDLAQFKQK